LYVCLVYFFVLASVISQETIREMTLEGGFVETVQAVFYFILAAIFFRLSLMIARDKGCRRATKIVYYGFTALFLLIAVEEISWGQGIIGFDTPRTLEEHNYQEETTIHNLGGYWNGAFFYLYSISVTAVVFVVGMLLPALKDRFNNVKTFLDMNRIPIPQPELVFGFVIGSLFIYKDDNIFFHLLALVTGTIVMAAVLSWPGASVVRRLKESKLFKLQLFAVVLTIPAVIVMNLGTSHYCRPMAETREFFISLSFLLFGILTLMERDRKNRLDCKEQNRSSG